MALIRRLRVFLRGEAGFSLAEVMVAGFILVLAVFPMVGMFDGAYLVSQTAKDINQSNECLRMYKEKVRTLPFYTAHTEDDLTTRLDVDDYYWGSRNPVTKNAWSTAPEVEIKASGVDPYPGLEVSVKMAYIDDELVSGISLEQAADDTYLASSWQPMALYGYDRPKTTGGKTLNLILYEVKVTTESGRTYTSTDLYTSPTDVVANVYIDKVVNTSADSSKLGTRSNSYGDCISAPHNKNGIAIRAYGEGFTASDVTSGKVQVKLVRLGGDSDIELKNLTYGTVGDLRYLEGTIDLDGTGIVEPYKPRKMPGYWYAWLVVNHVISVKSNAFVIEYPQPVYHSPGSDFHDSSGDKQGLESTTDEVLTLTNVDYVMNFVTGEYPNPGIGAVVQLVHKTTGPDGKPIDSVNGTNLVINPSTVDGYQTGLSITAHFDFTGHIGGDYIIRVINCIDRATPDKDVPGNTYFELGTGPYYYLEGPPAVNEVYVYEETPVSANPRHFAYDDRPYNYTLEIKGYNFDSLISASDVKLGLGGDTGANPPTGAINEVAPISATRVDDQTIRATFDFGPEVSDTERGTYWLYVKNTNDFGRLLNPAFDIRQPAPIIYAYSVKSLGLWQNYYGIDLEIKGECLDYDAVSGKYCEARIRELATPTNDWLATEAMGDPVYSDSGRRMDGVINLVDCNAGGWELYVKSQPAGLTDSGYTDIISGVAYQSIANITVGKPVLLTAGVPASGEPWSVSACTRYRNWNSGTGDWKEWRSWGTNTEGSGVPAWTYETDEGQSTPTNRTQGVMYFVRLNGMGFNEGNIDIHAVNDHGENTNGMDATWANVLVRQDRATAAVWIEMGESDALPTGPHIKDDGSTLNPIRIQIKNNVNNVWSAWYNDRIRVQIGNSY